MERPEPCASPFSRENISAGPVVALDDARGADADDAAMPAIAVDDQAVGVASARASSRSSCGSRRECALFLLAIAVQLVELHRHLGGFARILLA